LCGLTLTPGSYSTAGACSLSCELKLDGGSVSDPDWEIKCGGALSTAAASTVVFVNTGAPEDVSWVVGGTTTTGAGSTVIGNLYSVGAIDFGADTTWTGTLISTTAAVTLGAAAKSGGITTGGAITLGARAHSGNLLSTDGGAITLGAGSKSGAISTVGAETLGAGAKKGIPPPLVPAVPATEFMGDLCSLSLPLAPGIYHTAAACVMSCKLTLDNGLVGDPEWEFQCGGALSTAVDSGVEFTGSIGDTEDVIWNISGATATGAGSTMIGVLNSVGAITVGADSRWTGDVTSSAGAVGTGAGSRLIGTTQAEGAIAVGAQGQTGDLTSISGAITLGAFAQSGTTSASGGVTLGDGAVDGVDQFSPTLAPTFSPSSSPSQGPSQAPGGPPKTFTGNLCSLGSDLAPGVYITAAACTLACTLTLDGGAATDPKWHFHCGGALSTAADSEVVITNGLPKDVHWNIGAATTTGAGSLMVGNLDAVGAIILGAATEWEGDLTSSNGAVGTGAGSVVLGGAVLAYGAIDLGAGATSGDLTSTNGAIYLGANAVAGVCEAAAGGVTLGAGATRKTKTGRRLLRRVAA
jgi:hypothetical protein